VANSEEFVAVNLGEGHASTIRIKNVYSL